jgi:quercetin dioxygenase-like cupin family protein
MYGKSFPKPLALVGTALLLAACNDQATSPTGLPQRDAVVAAASHGAHSVAADLVPLQTEPFTFRAPLDPYRIHDLPDFLIHSRARSDLVVQRAVLAPGNGPWHLHPGPSFIIVQQGEIKLTRVTGTSECEDTPVFGAGQAFFEVANEVHRATVVSAEAAVLHIVRFNIPVGGAITILAEDPGCRD